jgi:hypothetical protein
MSTVQKQKQQTPKNKSQKQSSKPGRRARRARQRDRKKKVAVPIPPWRAGGSSMPSQAKKNKADQLMELAGGHGRNPLGARNQEVNREQISALNQDAALDVQPTIRLRALAYLALGIILAAKRRGWNSQNVPSVAYYAYQYMIGVFKSCVNGSTLEVTAAPRWFWEICAALAPKDHPWLSSRISYEAVIDESGPTPLTPTIVMGSGLQEYSIVFGDPTGAPVDGFPSLVTPPAYTDELGRDAFSSLWNVFVATPGEPSEIVGPIGEDAYNRRDCSAYALNYGRFGASYFAPGALASYLENEVRIDSPILAKFCTRNNEEDGNIFRAGMKFTNSGASACYIGPRCLEFESLDQFRNKGRAIVKFYDFDEFVEVFALFIGLVQEAVTKAANFDSTEYPLTIQQARIMLRQAMIPLFCNEKCADLRFAASGDEDPLFLTLLPFTVSDNGLSQTAISDAPIFPRFFNEMVQGCARLTASVFSGNRLVNDWLPVLAGLPDPFITNYTYDFFGEQRAVFRPPPVGPDPPAEIPIRMVDCSVSVPPDTLYLSLNGDEYAAIVSAHNSWMTKYSAFMTTQAKFSAVKANPLFRSVMLTRVNREIGQIQTATTVSQVPPGKVISKTVSSSSVSTTAKLTTQRSRKELGYSIKRSNVKQVLPESGSERYQFVECRAITAPVPFLADLVKYQSCMITPVFHSRNIETTGTREYMQASYGEGFAINLGSFVDDSTVVQASTNPTLYSQHLRAAELDVKIAGSSGPNEVEALLDQLSAKGEGGWLSTISSVLSTGSELVGQASKVFRF